MKSRHLAPLALAACAALTTLVSAQDTILDRLVKKVVKPSPKPTKAGAPSAGQVASVSQFDIAGVRLGMTRDLARAALQQSGYQVRDEDSLPSRTWEERIQAAALERQGRSSYGVAKTATKDLVGTKERRQKIKVSFSAKPEGMRVTKVEYGIPGEEITRQDYDANVRQKYGPPTFENSVQLTKIWCSAGEPRCSLLTFLKRPHLKSTLRYGNSAHELELIGSDEVEQARLKVLFDTEVERRAPRTRDTAF